MTSEEDKEAELTSEEDKEGHLTSEEDHETDDDSPGSRCRHASRRGKGLSSLPSSGRDARDVGRYRQRFK